jgi:TolB protein
MGLRILLVASWMVLAAACTQGTPESSELPPVSSSEATGTTPTAPSSTTTITPTTAGRPDTPSTLGPLPGTVVVSALDGALVTTAAGQPAEVVSAPPAGQIGQPTWDPSGRQLAYSLIDTTGAWLVVMDASGNETTRLATPFGAFYLAWSPDGERIGVLGASAEGLVELLVADLATGELVTLGRGTSLYFTWAPDSARILASIGLERVVVLDLEGGEIPITDQPGFFRAPEWTPDGDRVLYAAAELAPDTQSAAIGRPFGRFAQGTTRGQQVVSTELTTGETAPILRFQGQVAFDLSPDGTRLAYTISPLEAPFSFGPLRVIDLASGDDRLISESPVIAFEWDPSGSSLLYLTSSLDGATVQWNVVNDSGHRVYVDLIPSPVFAQQYLPFWDQYARSMTLWAPDGSGFVYPAGGGDGIATIEVQLLDQSVPIRLSEGQFAAWGR